jgi:hypothetical protein
MKTNQIADLPTQKTVKIAGFMFLFAFIVPTLNWVFVLSNFIDTNDSIATANNILSNELMFRIGITIELIMSLGLLILAMILYSMLKTINRYLALLALLLKISEAVLVAVMVVIMFIALHMLIETAAMIESTSKQFYLFAGILLNKHTALYSIPMVFLGLDMIIFSYLFFKSKYIPVLLAGFGIFSFALILIHALMYILTPEYAAMPIIQIIFYAPSGLFEIIIGIWLLSKGLNDQPKS